MTITERILGSRTLAALTSPHGVDRYLEAVNPMWAATEVRARVVDVHRETDGQHPVATLTLQPTSTWRGHRAGQYVQVGVAIDGARRTTRCFSISSAASLPGERFTITVRAHEEGVVSKFLVREAQPGQVLHLSQAEGEFTLTESPASPTNNTLLMISGGSGITPVMSQVRTLLRDGYDGHANRKVVFLHYARTPDDQIFADELAEITEADNGVDVHLRYGDDVFTEDELARLVPDYRHTDTWACGPAGLVQLITAAYAGSERLRVEFFKISTSSITGGTSSITGGTSSITGGTSSITGGASSITGGTARGLSTSGNPEGDVSFTRTGKSAANTGASLLEQAEALGLTPEYGCRMGICFSCTSRKTEGTVRNIRTGEESAQPDEDIRICVSAPVGNCVIEL